MVFSLAVLALAGCGGGEDDAEQTESPASASDGEPLHPRFEASLVEQMEAQRTANDIVLDCPAEAEVEKGARFSCSFTGESFEDTYSKTPAGEPVSGEVEAVQKDSGGKVYDYFFTGTRGESEIAGHGHPLNVETGKPE